MTHQNQQRAQYNRRGALHARQATKQTVTEVTVKPTATRRIITVPTRATTTPVQTVTISVLTTTSDSPVSTSDLVSAPEPSPSSSSSNPPPVPTTTPISITPTPTPVPKPATRVTQTTLRPPSSSTASTASDTTGQSNVGAIMGGVAGGIAALVVISMLVAFILRRYRKRKRDSFKANVFRKSALVLDDSDEKLLRPRPPSMIERRGTPTPSGRGMAPPAHPGSAYPHSEAPPSAGSIYSEQNTHSFAHHGAGAAGYPVAPNTYTAPIPPPMGPYGVAPLGAYGHEQPGYGAPPIPGTYGPGAYAPYGTQSRFGAPGQYQPTSYHDHGHSHPTHSHPYGHGAPNLNPNTTLSPAPSMNRLPNPFGRSPSSTPAPPANAEFSGRQLTMTASAFPSSADPSSSSVAPPAYEDDPSYDYQEIRRGEKATFGVRNVSEESAPSSRSTPNRSSASPSSHTLYDAGDAYGGM